MSTKSFEAFWAGSASASVANKAAEAKFAAFMAKVDAAIEKRCGLSSSDLADIDYRGMFEDGASPASAARAAIANEGG